MKKTESKTSREFEVLSELRFHECSKEEMERYTLLFSGVMCIDDEDYKSI